jgi:SAM-dependent methyltransferase
MGRATPPAASPSRAVAPNASAAREYRALPLLWHPHYLALVSNLRALQDFIRGLQPGRGTPLVLDIGCGYKPFAPFFTGTRLIGTDFSSDDATPDVVANNTALPFPDDCFDGCLASETLEHTPGYESAIAEMVRVTRPGGLLFVSVPFVHPMHHHPHDYQRITEYRFAQLFAPHEVLTFRPSNSIFSTWVIVFIYAVATGGSLLPRVVGVPLVGLCAMIANLLALAIELLVAIGLRAWSVLPAGIAAGLRARVRHPRSLEGVLTSLPLGYAYVVRVRKAGSP